MRAIWMLLLTLSPGVAWSTVGVDCGAEPPSLIGTDAEAVLVSVADAVYRVGADPSPGAPAADGVIPMSPRDFCDSVGFVVPAPHPGDVTPEPFTPPMLPDVLRPAVLPPPAVLTAGPHRPDLVPSTRGSTGEDDEDDEDNEGDDADPAVDSEDSPPTGPIYAAVAAEPAPTPAGGAQPRCSATFSGTPGALWLLMLPIAAIATRRGRRSSR